MLKPILFWTGAAFIALPVYDAAALAYNTKTGQVSLPILYPAALGQYLPEMWVGIIGAVLILLALFL
jgi:hypothetical protein